MTTKWITAGVLGLAMLLISHLEAKDITGAKDYPGIKRYAGSEIISYKVIPFDAYILGVGAPNPGEKPQQLEGKITRIIYRVTGGHTPLELLRNYESELTGDGFTALSDITPDKYAGGWQFLSTYYNQSAPGDLNSPFVNANIIAYFSGRTTKMTGDVYASVLIVKNPGSNFTNASKEVVKIQPGDLVVGLDIVETKMFEKKMVEVKADDIEKALADTGHIALYGIYFDTDKTEIKPESAAALEQIAKVLKDQSNLKLIVSGHTDNTGAEAHNLELSLGRAKAVVAALVGKYAIAADRLQSKGFASSQPVASNDTEEGRAKNRRVELVKAN